MRTRASFILHPSFFALCFYLALTLFMLGRVPDLHPELANWPDQFMLFVHPGSQWDTRQSRPHNIEYIGYDGQFFYDLARSPLHPPTQLDKPAYRTARILYPLVVRTLSFGQDDLIAPLLLLVNFLAIVVTTYLLAATLTRWGLGPGWAIGYVLWPGTVCAYLYDLSEPLCFLLVVAAVWLHSRLPGAVWRIGGLLLLASLTKELGLLFAGGWLLYYAAGREWAKVARLLTIWALPFAAWQLFLIGRFGKDGLSAGQPFSWFPLGGYFGAASYQPPLIERVAVPLATVVPLVWAGWLLWRAWQPAYSLAWLEGKRKRKRKEKGQTKIAGWTLLFWVFVVQALFLLFLPAATFIYLVDHARNATGLILTLYLLPLASFRRLRFYLFGLSLGLTALVIAFFATTSNAFLFSFGW